MAIGSAGGSKIVSTVAFVAHKVLSAGNELRKAVAAPRFHDQLLPNVTMCEHNFPEVKWDLYSMHF